MISSTTFLSQVSPSAFAQPQSTNDDHGVAVTDRQEQQQSPSKESGSVMAAVGGGEGRENNNTIAANLTQIFELKSNQTAFIASENLNIKFSKVNDSRCPANAMCIWEGDALVYLNVTKNGKDLGSVALGVNGRLANNTVVINTGQAGQQQQQTYAIHLLSLSRPITKSDYIATLIVTKPDIKVSTVLLKAGQRDGPLQITKIFPDRIDGVVFIRCPHFISEIITMKIGDSVSNGYNASMTLLSIIPNTEDAVFLKIAYPPRVCLISSEQMAQEQTNLTNQSSSLAFAANNNNNDNSSSISHQAILAANLTNDNNTSLQSSIQIKIDIVKQLPQNTPNATSILKKCERNNSTGIFSQDCQEKFIGKTNRLGQILLSTESFVVLPRPPDVYYVVATIIDNQSQQPIENAIVDGIVNSTDTFAVDIGRTIVNSAFVHTLKPDMSDWTYINWRMRG